MKKGFAPSVILAVCAAAGGYWFGQRHPANQTSATAPETTAAGTRSPASAGSSSGQTSPATATDASETDTPGRRTLAEVQKRLLALKGDGIFDLSGREHGEVKRILADLNVEDTVELLDFIEKQLPKNLRGRLRLEFLAHWAETDVRGAMAYAKALPLSERRDDSICWVVQTWAEDDAAAAADWATQLPKGGLRDRVMDNVLSTIADKDPAVAWNLSQKPGWTETKRQNLHTIFSSWARRDPAAAATRASGLISQEDLSAAYREISAVWAENDPQAALGWLKSLPEGYAKQSALQSASSSLVAADPRLAAEFANTLPRGTSRDQFMANVARQWSEADAAAALATTGVNARVIDMHTVKPIDEAAIHAHLYHPELPDPDLLIRTAGEQRISNFLLWQVSYAEIHVADVCWPDFRAEHLRAAFADYGRRVRKFGKVP